MRDIGDVDAQAPVPLLVARSEIASSKSRALAGSIVTVRDVAQVLARANLGLVEELRCERASSRTASSNVSGMLKARMTLRVSTPGARAGPGPRRSLLRLREKARDIARSR